MPSLHLPNKLTIAEYQALAAGIPKWCPGAVMTIAGVTYTAAEAAAYIQELLDTVTAVETAKTKLADARIAEAAAMASHGAVVKAMRENVSLMFIGNTTALAALAIPPKKARTPLSPEARIVAAAKARATRVARGTMGKRQKALIKGEVTGVIVTPVRGGAVAPSSVAQTTPEPTPITTRPPTAVGLATAVPSPLAPTTHALTVSGTSPPQALAG